MRQVKTRRISTVSVQGEDSFVVVRPPKWGLLRKAQQQSKADDAAAGVTFASDLIVASVVEWNWTDDDGLPLPLPKDNPAIIDELDADEVAFLVEQISGSFGSAPGN